MELARVKIDGGSLHNLLPRSIASRLGLPLHFGSSIRVRVANCTALTDQYCRLTIKVAGIETIINTCVLSELSSLLLGWEWTQEVNLLSDLRNYRYYLPRPYENLNELLAPRSVAKAEVGTEFTMGAAVAREETLPAEETSTCLGDDEGHSDKECKLDELASVESISAIGDDIISDAELFADAVSCQSSDDELF